MNNNMKTYFQSCLQTTKYTEIKYFQSPRVSRQVSTLVIFSKILETILKLFFSSSISFSPPHWISKTHLLMNGNKTVRFNYCCHLAMSLWCGRNTCANLFYFSCGLPVFSECQLVMPNKLYPSFCLYDSFLVLPTMCKHCVPMEIFLTCS